MTATSPWVSARVAADYLGVSQRTLARWRSSELLKPGNHWRRKFPAVNSPILFNLPETENAMVQAAARNPDALEQS